MGLMMVVVSFRVALMINATSTSAFRCCALLVNLLLSCAFEACGVSS